MNPEGYALGLDDDDFFVFSVSRAGGGALALTCRPKTLNKSIQRNVKYQNTEKLNRN